jgi:HSP20 family molecular chaperone IbpA
VKANREHHAFPSIGHLPIVDESYKTHQNYLHFPTAAFYSLGQKIKTKATWCKKQRKVELSPFCPETNIRETRLAYHIEVSLAGVGNKDTLVIKWMSPLSD